MSFLPRSRSRLCNVAGGAPGIVLIAVLLLGILSVWTIQVSAQAPNEVWVDDDYPAEEDTDGDEYFRTIQAAINAVAENGIVHVAEGIYDEQVIIDKPLTLEGQGDTTIIKPSTADSFTLFSRKYGGSDNTAAIVVANANATIKNLKIDGSEISSVPSEATMFVGILYRGVNGTIDSVTVDGINIANGNAIYISSMGKESNVEIKGCTISNFYKNGITANYEGLTVNIHDNNIIGSGPIDVAQNGIQVGFGATGSVMRNTVSDIAYTGTDYEAVGILFVDSSGTATDNTVTNCQAGIVAQAGWYPPVTCDVTIENNTIDATGLTGLSYIAGTGAVTWDENAIITVTIKNNDLTGAGYGEGVSIGDGAGTVNAIIEGNDISNWGDGVWIGSTSNEIKIKFNNIEGNSEHGIYSDVTVDAEKNWWGDSSGPHHPTLNPDGLGDEISDNVDFDPWLTAPITVVSSESGTDELLEFPESNVDVYVEGSAEVYVATYESNPGTRLRGSIGNYIDVYVPETTGLTELEIRKYYTDGEIAALGLNERSLMLYWWDGSAWIPCSDTGVNTGENYIWAKIRADTTPSLTDLTGTPFGAAGKPPVGGEIISMNEPAIVMLLIQKNLGYIILTALAVVAVVAAIKRRH